MIEQYVHWNEDIGEWQLKCVAYTGNNMRKQTPQPDDRNKVGTWSHAHAICFVWWVEAHSHYPRIGARPEFSKRALPQQFAHSIRHDIPKHNA